MGKVQLNLAAIGIGLALALPAGAATICVDPGNSNCESTIQAGINAAASGDTVRVASGLYEEAVTIATAGVTLRGSRGVFIDPSTPTGNAITVNATTSSGRAIRQSGSAA